LWKSRYGGESAVGASRLPSRPRRDCGGGAETAAGGAETAVGGAETAVAAATLRRASRDCGGRSETAVPASTLR
ncbi:hypothetical protein, partial [Mycobacterium asiaticum]|uniref:hypothetical protein n=1 Tax=Mycobacterium asiaticum TaxID=1790 RepID=UPI001C12AB1C